MWNPFKKSKAKQLKEIAAEATINFLYDLQEKCTEELLVNKDADSEKIYQMLASNCDIAGLSDKQICFIKNYTYRIEQKNEKYNEFTISGDFYCEDFRKLTQTIHLVIRDKNDRVDVFANIVSWQLCNEGGENPTIKADIIFHTPFKEEIIKQKIYNE